jgi:adenine-specific DNA-methyltransferase
MAKSRKSKKAPNKKPIEQYDHKDKARTNNSLGGLVTPETDKEEKEKTYSYTYIVEVHGFDYFNTKTGNLESGGKKNSAMWMLDPDYGGRTLYPRQVFSPMADGKEGWSKLAKNRN